MVELINRETIISSLERMRNNTENVCIHKSEEFRCGYKTAVNDVINIVMTTAVRNGTGTIHGFWQYSARLTDTTVTCSNCGEGYDDACVPAYSRKGRFC